MKKQFDAKLKIQKFQLLSQIFYRLENVIFYSEAPFRLMFH